MTVGGTISTVFRGWTDIVADAVVAGVDRVASPRTVRLVERADGEFDVEAPKRREGARVTIADGVLHGDDLASLLRGCRVEIVLLARRFLFRPLDLPTRASDFLDGIVRAQIDRLTPWSAADAVFGCSQPVPNGADGIRTTIAATTRKLATGYVEAVSALHPASVAVLTDIPDASPARVKVFEQKARGHIDPRKLGTALRAGLGVALAAAAVSVAVSAYVANDLSAQEAVLANDIAQRRAAIRASGGSSGDATPVAALERRKFETPASVLVLEALTQVLPDHTYVTEFNLVGNKLQIVGITRDAPSLIALIEQSALFTRATFYAPTTRAPSDSGERFHIEARVQAKSS